jgi:hypothetical protein
MNRSVFVVLSLGIVAIFGATITILSVENNMSASKDYCPESKLGLD